jgi:hypothetical protein
MDIYLYFSHLCIRYLDNLVDVVLGAPGVGVAPVEMKLLKLEDSGQATAHNLEIILQTVSSETFINLLIDFRKIGHLNVYLGTFL